jgi:hypothetical protein
VTTDNLKTVGTSVFEVKNTPCLQGRSYEKAVSPPSPLPLPPDRTYKFEGFQYVRQRGSDGDQVNTDKHCSNPTGTDDGYVIAE